MRDSDIDRLYQLPLSEFTKARDELAKSHDEHRADIRRLQKPSVPAWAVNQLYWHDRGTYDALIAAADKLRTAQMASLGGKSADVPKAEGAHAQARRTAVDRIRTLLEARGEKASPAVQTAIQETLDALPADDPPGRLVRPLKPAGFEALAALLGGRKIAPKRADVVRFTSSAKSRVQSVAERERDAKRAAEQREKERLKARERVARQLHDAQRTDRNAQAALERARRSLRRAEQAHAEATKRLEQVTEALDAARREVQAAERKASQAGIARSTLEHERDALG